MDFVLICLFVILFIMPKKIPLLLFCIAVCEGAGIVGSFFTVSAIPTWYITLVKPVFSPPNWVFAPVWIILYALMGISLYLVISDRKKVIREKAIRVFAIQLVLNTTWSIVFFGMHNIFLGLIIIVLLWIFIALSIWVFGKINKTSAMLLWPYLAWVSFAVFLNYSIWILNK